MKKSFTFHEPLWQYPGKGSWHFITLPEATAREVDFYFGHLRKGWGSLPVHAQIGEVVWETSIFPDKKSKSYLLPVKVAVRKRAQLKAGVSIDVQVTIEE